MMHWSLVGTKWLISKMERRRGYLVCDFRGLHSWLTGSRAENSMVRGPRGGKLCNMTVRNQTGRRSWEGDILVGQALNDLKYITSMSLLCTFSYEVIKRLIH